ncbi:MAG: SH3 domain-containing protein [Planctomycetota bacterium]
MAMKGAFGRGNRSVWVVAGAVLLASVAIAAAKTVYVTSSIAKVREKAVSGSPVLATPAPGDSLEVLAEEKGFLQVKLKDGRAGWISGVFVGEEKPKSEVRDGFIQKSRTADGRETVTSGAARGLSDESKVYAKGKNKAESAAAVERMENVTVSPEALEKFQQEGKIGEYREVKP